MKILLLIAFVIVGNSQIFARPRSQDDSLEEFKEYMNDYYLNTPLVSDEEDETTDGDYKEFEKVLVTVMQQSQDTSSEEMPLNEGEELVSNDSNIIEKKEISTMNEPLDDSNYFAYQLSNDGNDDDSDEEGTETKTEITENDDLSSSAQVVTNKHVEHISTEDTAEEEDIKESVQDENDSTDNDDDYISTMGVFFYPPVDHPYVEEIKQTSGVNMAMYRHGYPQVILNPLSLEDAQKESDESEESQVTNESVENVKPTTETPMSLETEEEGNEETVKEENDDTDNDDQHTSNSSWNDGNEFRFVADVQDDSNESEEKLIDHNNEFRFIQEDSNESDEKTIDADNEYRFIEDVQEESNEEEEDDNDSEKPAFLFVPDADMESKQEEDQDEDEEEDDDDDDDDDWILDHYDENEDDDEVDYDDHEPETRKVSTIDLSGNTDLQNSNTDNNNFGPLLSQLAVSSSNSQLLANEHERNLKEFVMTQKHLNDNLKELNAQNEKLFEKFSSSANEHSDYNGQTHRDIEEEMNEMLKSVDQIKARIVEMQKLEQTNNYHMLLNALLKELYGKTL